MEPEITPYYVERAQLLNQIAALERDYEKAELWIEHVRCTRALVEKRLKLVRVMQHTPSDHLRLERENVDALLKLLECDLPQLGCEIRQSDLDEAKEAANFLTKVKEKQ